ncbi:MAG: (Fe-S)-binding protein [Bacillota bacterium]
MAALNREQLLNCALCPNMCRCECPVVQSWGKEAVAPSAKARLSHLLLEDKLNWHDEAVETLAACVGCRGCSLLCPFPELDLAGELLSVREEAFRRGARLNRAAPYLNNLRRHGSPYGSEKRAAKAGMAGGEVLFFAGCTAAANNPAAVKAARALLEAAGMRYQMIEEFCCGYPASIWGDLELARQLAAENRALIAASGARRLITGCPECWHTFTCRYPEWDSALPVEVVDSTTFFLELLRAGRLKPRAVAGLDNVTYHDPCIWARVEPRCAQPRDLLQFIPGLALIEANPSGANSRCCGGGQMAQITFPDLAEKIARQRLKEMPAGAAVVTACPFCRESLLVDGGRVLELVELLGMSCL